MAPKALSYLLRLAVGVVAISLGAELFSQEVNRTAEPGQSPESEESAVESSETVEGEPTSTEGSEEGAPDAASTLPQDAEPAEESSPQRETPPSGQVSPKPPVEAKPAEERQKPAPVNRVRQKITQDFFQTPEDPSFLYETRYIPEHRQKEEFLTRELEREVIEERISEAKDFKEALEGLDIKLPGWKQVVVFTGIVILFILYRIRLRKSRRR